MQGTKHHRSTQLQHFGTGQNAHNKHQGQRDPDTDYDTTTFSAENAPNRTLQSVQKHTTAPQRGLTKVWDRGVALSIHQVLDDPSDALVVPPRLAVRDRLLPDVVRRLRERVTGPHGSSTEPTGTGIRHGIFARRHLVDALQKKNDLRLQCSILQYGMALVPLVV